MTSFQDHIPVHDLIPRTHSCTGIFLCPWWPHQGVCGVSLRQLWLWPGSTEATGVWEGKREKPDSWTAPLRSLIAPISNSEFMFTYSFSVPGASEAGKRACDYYTWWNLYQIHTSSSIKITSETSLGERLAHLLYVSAYSEYSHWSQYRHTPPCCCVKFMWPSDVAVVLWSSSSIYRCLWCHGKFEFCPLCMQ